MKAAGYPDGFTQFHHDEMMGQARAVYDEQNAESVRVASLAIARDEIESCAPAFVEWVRDYKDAFELLPLLSAFYRAEFNSAALADLNKLKAKFVNEYAKYVAERDAQ